MAVNVTGQTGKMLKEKEKGKTLTTAPMHLHGREDGENGLHKQVERQVRKRKSRKIAWNLPRPLSAMPPV